MEVKRDFKKQGKLNRASGARFELVVRKDLEERGWIVDKWTNNIVDKKLVKVKNKWTGPGRPMMLGAGFPDFVAFRPCDSINVKVIGVEAKINGYLKLEEKEKCKWYLDNHIFSRILIAKKTKQGRRIVVEYNEFNNK